MGCTTILVGKGASYDGSPLVARNEDSANGEFNPKRIVVVHPDDQPRTYTSVIAHLTVELTEEPLRYTAAPNAVLEEGIWGEAGINAANVAMSATETLTTNERVLSAGHASIRTTDEGVSTLSDEGALREALAGANEALAATVRTETESLLDRVLLIASNGMHNRFSRSDN